MDWTAAYRRASRLLQANDTDKAYKLLTKTIAAHPKESTSLYCLAGMAQWIQGDCVNAVSHWKLALKCRGGIPFDAELLLYFAAVRAPTLYKKADAISLLDKACRKWGCIAHLDFVGNYLVRRIDEQQLRELVRAESPEFQVRVNVVIDFYLAVEQLSAIAEDRYRAAMKTLGELDLYPKNDNVLEDEWILAKYEGTNPNHAV